MFSGKHGKFPSHFCPFKQKWCFQTGSKVECLRNAPALCFHANGENDSNVTLKNTK